MDTDWGGWGGGESMSMIARANGPVPREATQDSRLF